MITKTQEPKKTFSKIRLSVILFTTILYWLWESQASGNIRVDLLLFYPALMVVYLVTLWERFKFYAILITMALMALNFYFFIFSYDLFNKNLG